jgi:hypothetical protein
LAFMRRLFSRRRSPPPHRRSARWRLRWRFGWRCCRRLSR